MFTTTSTRNPKSSLVGIPTAPVVRHCMKERPSAFDRRPVQCFQIIILYRYIIRIIPSRDRRRGGGHEAACSRASSARNVLPSPPPPTSRTPTPPGSLRSIWRHE